MNTDVWLDRALIPISVGEQLDCECTPDPVRHTRTREVRWWLHHAACPTTARWLAERQDTP